jgi:hypothetical protein
MGEACPLRGRASPLRDCASLAPTDVCLMIRRFERLAAFGGWPRNMR